MSGGSVCLSACMCAGLQACVGPCPEQAPLGHRTSASVLPSFPGPGLASRRGCGSSSPGPRSPCRLRGRPTSLPSLGRVPVLSPLWRPFPASGSPACSPSSPQTLPVRPGHFLPTAASSCFILSGPLAQGESSPCLDPPPPTDLVISLLRRQSYPAHEPGHSPPVEPRDTVLLVPLHFEVIVTGYCK